MSRHLARVVRLVMPLLLATSACSSANDQPKSDVVLSPDLRVLDDGTLSHLSAVSDDQSTLTFDASTHQLAVLAAGDVIASGILKPLLPRGMLRKVVSVSGSGPITVTTEPAALTDAIVRGSFDASFHLTPDQTTSAALHAASADGSSGGLTYGLDNLVIYDADGKSSTTHDQVRLSGSISIDPFTHFPVQIDSGFTKVDLDISGDESASLTVTADEATTFTKRVDLDTVLFEPLVIDVGGLPVVLAPKLTFYAGVDGSASAKLTAGVNEQAHLDVGVGYHDGSFGPFNKSGASGGFDPPSFAPGANAGVKAMAGARLSLYLWAIETAYVDADVYARAKVEPDQNPWWSLYGGAEAKAHIGLLGLGYDAPLGHVEKLLASAPGGSSTAQITNWARAYSGASRDQLVTLAPNGSQGWLAGGTSNSFTPSPNDAWLVATDPIGEVMWQRAYEDLDAVRAIDSTSDGNALVATGGVDLGGAGLMKLDPNGATLWSKEVSDPGGAGARIDDIVALPDAGALLGGTLGSDSSADYWVTRIDAKASPVWSYTFGGNGEDDLQALAATADGGCLAVGTSYSFSSLPLLWAVRLDANGKVVWQKSYDTGGDVYGRSAVAAAGGGFLVGGEDLLDALALRLGEDGSVSWATDVASGVQDAEINGAVGLPNGGFAVAGGTNTNAWIVGLDSGGSVAWSHEFGGSQDERIGGMLEYHGVGEPLQALPDGSLVAAGTSSSFSADYDAWLLHTTPNGNVTFAAASGASETNPSGSYSSAPITVADTSVVEKALSPSVVDVDVVTVSTDAKTIDQAP